MTTATLTQVQEQVDQLSPVEQIRLLDYISSRILKAVTSIQISSVPKERNVPIEWEELFQVGRYIASLPSHGEETMTQSVTTMRR